MKTKSLYSSLLCVGCALILIGAAACTGTDSEASAKMGGSTNASAAHAGAAGPGTGGVQAGPAGSH